MTPITKLAGVGAARAAALQKLGIETFEDLLLLYPHRYEDRSMVLPIDEVTGHMGENVSIIATVVGHEERRIYGGKLLTRFTVADDSGVMTLTYFNNPYVKHKLKEGEAFNFYGKPDPKMLLNMIAPQAEPIRAGETPGVFPIYPLSAGLNQGQMRKWVKEAYRRLKGSLPDPLPERLREKYHLLSLTEALEAVHFPRDNRDVLLGRRRLIFEELLYFQLGLALYSRREKDHNRFPIPQADDGFLKLQPFTPTNSQRQAIAEILADMNGEYAMNRLLQGDVGSGKTYVAGEAAYAALSAGHQVAIMAPTEILARQHAEYFRPLFEELGYSTDLLVGSLTAKEKREAYARLKSGETRLAIGTHALLQDKVQFQRLGLVIADEQHRFGVRQRAVLAQKGDKPHILVMSATPIPRTMALMVWGDLDLSVLSDLPAGRKPIKTYLVGSDYRKRLDGFIQKQLAEQGQVYMVCPLVEENEELDLKSAEALFEELKAQYGDLADMIHGKMKAAKKDAAMAKFVAGKTKILVSTTVIEVGINVPAATLMVILNAERFGLSQLHQLRGRVGRGQAQAYCVLVSDNQNPATRERMDFFCSTTDGFALSQKDLELRGPGDFFGNMQHGLPKMQIADCATDLELLSLSHGCAKRLLQFDPALSADYNRLIKQRVEALFTNENTIFN
ncbi:MAG: ATP-dependent DNA helicase RecG [Clostridia bacterium]|nr:ATP-dependent DNA helicase RecG [Clostridia bacterium]